MERNRLRTATGLTPRFEESASPASTNDVPPTVSPRSSAHRRPSSWHEIELDGDTVVPVILPAILVRGFICSEHTQIEGHKRAREVLANDTTQTQ
jgi:hypothetical protein